MFDSTKNKDSVRNLDRTIVEAERKRKKRPLTYFGLPGPQMLDVLSWKDFLGTIVAVESDWLSRHVMLTTAFDNGIDSRLQVMAGDIDELLIKGHDLNGWKPRESPFDVVNLDYVGGPLVKDRQGDSRRMQALRKLFEVQRSAKRDFLLLVTLNTRNRDEGEFNQAMDQILREARGDRFDFDGAVEAYKASRYDFKMKVYFAFNVDRLAAANGFVCSAESPVTYLGTGRVRMVHFAFRFGFVKGRVGVAKAQPIARLVNLKFREAEGGEVRSLKLPALAPD